MMGHAFCSASRSALWAVVLGSLCSAACDRTGSSAQSTQCARFCEALEKCDDATDLLDCKDHCSSDEVRSDAYFRVRAECGEELSCNRWVQEVDSQGVDRCDGDCNLNACVDRRLAKLKLSEEDKQRCMSLSTKLNACDPALDPTDLELECTRISPLLSQAYLLASQVCTERVCDRIQTCLDALADEYETELRLFSGTLQSR